MLVRPARAEELQRAQELVVQSINDLTERHGFGPMAAVRGPQFQLFSLQDDPDGLWVAENEGEILGFAFSWVCGKLWFLAELFVSPRLQCRGFGNQLIERTLQHARKAGATDKALITFTFNVVSQSLYVRHGLFPLFPIYFMKVARESLLDRLRRQPLSCVPLQDTASHQQCLAQIDALVLGISREKHHRYLIGDAAMRAVLLYAGNDCVGYVYVSPDGHIGPLAVVQPDAADSAMQAALTLATETGSPQVSAFIPGKNTVALGLAIELGMRITIPMVLMASRDFGDWSRYLPRNPGFM